MRCEPQCVCALLWTRIGNSSQRQSGDPIEPCTSKCCQPIFDDAMFHSDVKTWPISNGNSIADHMKPPVTVVNRYAAFEDKGDCMFDSKMSDNYQMQRSTHFPSGRSLGGKRRREIRDSRGIRCWENLGTILRFRGGAG